MEQVPMPTSDYIQIKRFGDYSIDDPFFRSLIADYGDPFRAWYARKADETCLTFTGRNGRLAGFLYLKSENGPVNDVSPSLPPGNWTKIGTFKIDAHGTKLGQRFLKRCFDYAIHNGSDGIYVTAFPRHKPLIQLFLSYGFEKAAEKISPNGAIEAVYVRRISESASDPRHYYPLVKRTSSTSYWLLAIYPEYHTKLFPDSKLHGETYDALSDVGHTNSIEKTYICALPMVSRIKPGDAIVMYRTSDISGKAYFRSVATSICTHLQTRPKRTFKSFEEFSKKASSTSVFTRDELQEWWKRKNFYCVDMLYNFALNKRPNRKALLETVGISDQRPNLLSLAPDHFSKILALGQVHARLA